MQLISYVKISNFKGFGENITIDFSQPSVLIGSNNSGKTTVLQALAMWNMGLKTWFQEKGSRKSKSKMGTSINRLDITQVPIKEAKFFWQNASVRSGTANTELKIAVGVLFEGMVRECTAIFKYFNAESIYCFPDEASFEIEGLLVYAITLDVKILYPMSGIAREEPFIAEGRIDVLIGQGQTSEVLRNICYKVIENDEINGTNDWLEIVDLMQKLFQIILQRPFFNAGRGTVELSYFSQEIKTKKNSLDIGLSGRGQQEVLLLIAYIYTHKKAILLLDEPDAHLEILRQKQVFSLLKRLAEKNQNQLIIATHSEVILNEASDENLMLLLNGCAINLSETTSKKTIKSTLKEYGLEHYYKAQQCKAVFYTEGNTDIDILRAFANRLKHPAEELLNSTIYSYYVADNEPYESLEKDINLASGYYQSAKKHFQAVHSCVPTLKGIGIFDNDNKGRRDEITPSLALLYWQKYEIENYLTFPYVIENYILGQQKTQIEGKIIKNRVSDCINKAILTELLNNNLAALNNYKNISGELQKELFKTFITNKKASNFLDICFKNVADTFQSPIFLSKGQYYLLVPFVNTQDIDSEMTEKLDFLVQYLA